MKHKKCVIFGGAGFIGSHFARYLIEHDLAAEVWLADIARPCPDYIFDPVRVRYVEVDVRQPIKRNVLPGDIDLIVNLAAVHREPGHETREYYETNICGAENVCEWAAHIGCRQLIFTSSIAPYGASEALKTEASLPVPVSAYGGSKLVAEKIHISWQRSGPGRRLVIVRPGVVFGPGEGGNVTRLVQATIRGYFIYMANRETRKAGGYVKELTNTMVWALDRIPEDVGGVLLYNFTMEHAPTVEAYVQATCKVARIRRFIPNLPYPLLLGLSMVIEAVARPFGIEQPISPVRIRKLRLSNNIEPSVLRSGGYVYQYTLESAMRDWFLDRPDEWQ